MLQGVDRRAALGLLAAAAAVSTAQPSEAAYGDAARVFAGQITNKSGGCSLGPRRRGWAGRNRPIARRGPMRGAAAFPPRPPLTGPLPLSAGFIPYAGEGFALLIPSKWNPSKEQDFPGLVLRCVPAQQRGAAGRRSSEDQPCCSCDSSICVQPRAKLQQPVPPPVCRLCCTPQPAPSPPAHPAHP